MCGTQGKVDRCLCRRKKRKKLFGARDGEETKQNNVLREAEVEGSFDVQLLRNPKLTSVLSNAVLATTISSVGNSVLSLSHLDGDGVEDDDQQEKIDGSFILLTF
jgi:hypothetical protein